MLSIAARLRIASILSNAQHGNELRLLLLRRLVLRCRQNRDKEKEDAVPKIFEFHWGQFSKELIFLGSTLLS